MNKYETKNIRDGQEFEKSSITEFDTKNLVLKNDNPLLKSNTSKEMNKLPVNDTSNIRMVKKVN